MDTSLLVVPPSPSDTLVAPERVPVLLTGVDPRHETHCAVCETRFEDKPGYSTMRLVYKTKVVCSVACEDKVEELLAREREAS